MGLWPKFCGIAEVAAPWSGRIDEQQTPAIDAWLPPIARYIRRLRCMRRVECSAGSATRPSGRMDRAWKVRGVGPRAFREAVSAPPRTAASSTTEDGPSSCGSTLPPTPGPHPERAIVGAQTRLSALQGSVDRGSSAMVWRIAA